MPRTILVTGANGQLGSEIKALAPIFPAFDFTFVTRDELDLGKTDSIQEYFSGKSFDAIINCAAYTAVDKAESDTEAADQVNHLAVKALAQVAKVNNSRFVHISTDYVFDGKNYRPYNEKDPVSPQNIYGKSKRMGEEALLDMSLSNSIIIRTSWVYSSFGNNFVKTMRRLGSERNELGVIFDQVGTPTYAKDLARIILEIIPNLHNEKTEIYHFSNEGVCSWYDFAKAIFEYSNLPCKVNPIETKAYPTPASRPHYSLLNKSKIKTHFNIDIPYWRDSLHLCLDALKENI